MTFPAAVLSAAAAPAGQGGTRVRAPGDGAAEAAGRAHEWRWRLRKARMVATLLGSLKTSWPPLPVSTIEREVGWRPMKLPQSPPWPRVRLGE